jgi:phosphatidylglycerol:prolipoprotein diacylglycerol transferase
LIGGLVAVESTKWWLGVTTRTGDLFAIPLAAGTAIGRVGCFLTGLEDRTHGTPTTL